MRFAAFGALVRSAYEVTGSRQTALLLARRAARRLTGARTELEAVAELNAVNDLPPQQARVALLALFDAALSEV